MKIFFNRMYNYSLFILLILLFIAILFFRDLPEKPLIDVIITSLSSIISAFIAAFVAFRVADYQISHNEKKEELDKRKKLVSRIKLLRHEISYNKNQLKICLDLVPTLSEQEIDKALSENLRTDLWDTLAVDIIEDMNYELFSNIVELYYKISRLKQEGTFEHNFCNTTFAECTSTNAKIEIFLENPESFLYPTS
ncbi:hypothetical protein P9436_11355 [Lysinibacillus capsici]|uniref:hypothetical protein n=1 Tax=Lysinibacillus capsici TaxID=2115968 RepID=UPI002E1AB5E1|nr:hypothetical protein [Lysinibacillus capsici]